MSQFTSDEFIDSFLEEANEYLQIIQQGLLVLDRSFETGRSKNKNKPAPEDDPESVLAQINELLRALHSLKGISGMVGLNQAAALSHSMESVLKPIQLGQQETTAAAVDKLIEASKLLSFVIQTLSDPGLQMPPIDEMLSELESLASHPGSTTPSAYSASANTTGSENASFSFGSISLPAEIAAYIKDPEWKKMREAFASGEMVALASYEPTQQQIQDGKNVNYVRESLLRETKLIKAAPVIRDGAVRFIFIVASNTIPPTPELAFLDWRILKEDAPLPDIVSPENYPSHLSLSAASQPAPVSLRVELSRMDSLMQLVGDLVVTRSRIIDVLPRLAGAPPGALDTLEETIARMERQVQHLRDAVMHIRLVQLSEVFARIPLAVRDLARQTGKNVQLIIEGGETEIDKALVERLADPLMHLVRNAVTHGIELPSERDAAGKSAEGTIRLRGYTQGDQVVVAIEDDGAGVRVEMVRAKALEAGWLESERPFSDTELLETICRPGFSTQTNADMGAGRGMGMNIVSEMISSLGGDLSLANCPGEGAVFTIHLPLTLTIIHAFIVEVGSERFAVPQTMVSEVIEVPADQVTRVGLHELVSYRGSAIPLVSLRKKYQLPDLPSPPDGVTLASIRNHDLRGYGLVVGQHEKQAAVLIDRVVGLREMVVHPFSDPLIREPSISGVTELGDGSVALILDCYELIGQG